MRKSNGFPPSYMNSNYNFQYNNPNLYSLQKPTFGEEPLDWEFVKQIDPNLLNHSNDLSILKPFISDFIVADFDYCSSTLLNHPLLIRLCKILQYSLMYMNNVQKQLQKKVEQKNKEIESISQKLKKVYSFYKKTSESLHKKSHHYFVQY